MGQRDIQTRNNMEKTRIGCPYLVDDDEVSPIHSCYEMFR